jgi:hypothetical protein
LRPDISKGWRRVSKAKGWRLKSKGRHAKTLKSTKTELQIGKSVLIRVHPVVFVVLLPLFHRVNPWLKNAEIIFAPFALFCGQTFPKAKGFRLRVASTRPGKADTFLKAETLKSWKAEITPEVRGQMTNNKTQTLTFGK